MHWAFIVVIILVIVLIIFGPRRLTKLGGALGQSVREFRKENSATDGTNPSTKDKPG